RGFAANDTLNVGCLGTGGRCRTLMQSLAKVPGVRLAAVCDVYDAHLAEARKLSDPDAFATAKFREVLDRKDIDAVLIGAPDHWHVPMTVAACEAARELSVESPMPHPPAGGPEVVAAQDKNRRIVQVGTQQRSMPHFQKARELLKQGRIGKPFKVHMTWN